MSESMAEKRPPIAQTADPQQPDARLPDIRPQSQPRIPGDYQFRAMRRGPRLQRFWHRHKLTVMTRLLPLAPHEVVVDVGCGSGNLTLQAARSARLAVGLDPSLDAARFCRSRPSAGSCEFAVATGDGLPLADGAFDAALLVEVIEHLADPGAVLSELHRSLAAGGRLLVTTPNYGRGSPWPAIEWLADRSGVVAKMAEEQHVQAYDPAALATAVIAAGFEVERLGTFYRWSPLLALFQPRRAAELVVREVDSGRLDGALIYAVARKARVGMSDLR